MNTNAKSLVKLSVQGQVSPHVRRDQFLIGHHGKPVVLPGVGGITYNVKIGDAVFGWAGDHIEPGVSIKAVGDKKVTENTGLNVLACIGNSARVISGDAKGDTGVVTGKHGGIEHVLIYFPQQTLEKLTMDDKILIQGFGQGLEIAELPDVRIMNLDPDLLNSMPLSLENDTLEAPVVGIIPPELMGSGIGAPGCYSGDYDLTTADMEVIKRCGLENLRFGDLVAIQDTDNSYGRCFRKGAVSIGVVVHSDCEKAGHGPGITTIFTSASGKIRPKKVSAANIGDYLSLTVPDSHQEEA